MATSTSLTPRSAKKYLFARRFSPDASQVAAYTSPGVSTDTLSGAFFWLSAFCLVYFARPQELIRGLAILPLAKITSGFAVLSLAFSIGRSPRQLRDLPREAYFLLGIIVLLFVSAFLSPVWRGGAFFSTLGFSRICVLWLLAFLVITNLARLRRIIFIQASSVALISAFAMIKGHSVERLQGVVGGVYSNPNDLAFAIVLSMPFCLAFCLSAKSVFARVIWCLAMLVTATTLLFTASRAGFIDIIITGAVCLWQFGVREKRLHIIFFTTILGVVLLVVAGGKLKERFLAMSASADYQSQTQESAAESYEQRKALVGKALKAIAHYPVLGLGAGNFLVYSEVWKAVHVSYLQIAADGGIPVLVLYLLFFGHGFANLRHLRQLQTDDDTMLFVNSLHASLIGFVVGAAFAPQAYLYFPYLTVGYTSVLAAIVKDQKRPEVDPVATLRAGFGGYRGSRVRAVPAN